MIWICGSRPVCLVAPVAVGRERRVVIVGVALRAWDGGMSSGERKYRRMIECRWAPCGCRVTQRTISRESSGSVVRIGGPIEVGLVAPVACSRGSSVDIVDVACSAGQRGMRSSECISGVLQMVELRVEPGIDGVATFARRRKAGRRMIQHWRLKIFLMARVARRRQAGELTGRCVLMTIVALQHGVRADQREAVLVVANLLQ